MGCRSRVKGRKAGTLGHSSHAVAGGIAHETLGELTLNFAKKGTRDAARLDAVVGQPNKATANISKYLIPTRSYQVTMASDYGNVAHLLPTTYKQTVAAWLTEDSPSFDYGGFVVGEDEKTATLYGKSAVCFI